MKTLPLLVLLSVLVASLTAQEVVNRTHPRPLQISKPAYPEALAETGRSGSAIISVVIGPDGRIGVAEVKSADDEAFGQAALAAVKTWQFEPATADGAPIAVRVDVPFNFTVPPEQRINAMVGRKLYQPAPESGSIIGQKDLAKRLKTVKRIQPQYPRALVREGVSARAKVHFLIAPDGHPINPEIQGELRQELILPAIMAVAMAAYDPPVAKDGRPVYVEMTADVRFAPPQRAGDDSPSFNTQRNIGGGGGGGGDGGGGD